MDINLYTLEIYQRGGSGVLTCDFEKEEVGIADWSSFSAPLPSFDVASTMAATPDVSASGTGILRYKDHRFPEAAHTNAIDHIFLEEQQNDAHHGTMLIGDAAKTWFAQNVRAEVQRTFLR